MSSPISQISEALTTSSFVFIVVFRGHWCPFCLSYLHQLQSLTPSITAAHGTILTITSEPASLQAKTRASSGFEGAIISDLENQFAAEAKKRALLDVAVSKKDGYPRGMMQPAVLVLRGGKEGRGRGAWEGLGQEDVLFNWAVVPSLMNFGGAKDRPDLQQVWENVEAQIKGEEKRHEKIGRTTAIGLLKGKLFG